MVSENRPYKTCQEVYFWVKKTSCKIVKLGYFVLTFVTICNVVFSFDSDKHVFWDLQSFNHSSIGCLSCMQKTNVNWPCNWAFSVLLTCNIWGQTTFLFWGLSKQLLVLSCSITLGSVHDIGITQIVCLLIKLGMYFLFSWFASSLDINCGSVSIIKCLLK